MLKWKLTKAFLLTIMISVKILLSYLSLSGCEVKEAFHHFASAWIFVSVFLLVTPDPVSLLHSDVCYNLWNLCCVPSEKCVANLHDNGKSNMAAIMSKVY